MVTLLTNGGTTVKRAKKEKVSRGPSWTKEEWDAYMFHLYGGYEWPTEDEILDDVTKALTQVEKKS